MRTNEKKKSVPAREAEQVKQSASELLKKRLAQLRRWFPMDKKDCVKSMPRCNECGQEISWKVHVATHTAGLDLQGSCTLLCEHSIHEGLGEPINDQNDPCPYCEVHEKFQVSKKRNEKAQKASEQRKFSIYQNDLFSAIENACEILGKKRKSEEAGKSCARSLLESILRENLLFTDKTPSIQKREVTQCPGCGIQNDNIQRLFCGDYCQQASQLVRYIRKCIKDDRMRDQKILIEGIGTKALMVLSGGYPVRERNVLDSIRSAVFERDSNLCECGEPATDIDHRNGNSNRIEDLRAVCRACNLKAMNAGAHSINYYDNPEIYEILEGRRKEISRRVASPSPLLECDREEWNKNWKKIQSQRRAFIKEYQNSKETCDHFAGYQWEGLDVVCGDKVDARCCRCNRPLCMIHGNEFYTDSMHKTVSSPAKGSWKKYCPQCWDGTSDEEACFQDFCDSQPDIDMYADEIG